MTAHVAARMAEAASAFLASLDDTRHALAAWPFPSDDERQRWFYTPTDHGGLALADMRPGQQRHALRLLASGLSHPGYVTAATIIGHENVLDEIEGWRSTFDRERGRDPGLYYVRVFGTPEHDDPWSWRFGGHHVSVHAVVAGGEVVATTPCFFGCDPASSPLLGPHPLRPLAGVEDLGRELVRSLDDEQRDVAIVSPVAPYDLVNANRSRVGEGDLPLPLPEIWRGELHGDHGRRMNAVQEAIEKNLGVTSEHLEAVRYSAERPSGLSAGLLRAPQQELLRALLDAYVGRVPDEVADAEQAKYAGDRIGALTFEWAGSLEPGEPHWYRVQGPRLLAEYDNTQRGANHIHSVWRDPAGDFGVDALRLHRHAHH